MGRFTFLATRRFPSVHLVTQRLRVIMAQFPTIRAVFLRLARFMRTLLFTASMLILVVFLIHFAMNWRDSKAKAENRRLTFPSPLEQHGAASTDKKLNTFAKNTDKTHSPMNELTRDIFKDYDAHIKKILNPSDDKIPHERATPQTRPGGKSTERKLSNVLMFYNISSDKLQPIWHEPEFPGGRRGRKSSLTVVMYNLPNFVKLTLWNDADYLSRCNVSCRFSDDLSLMDTADAVIFFAVKMPVLSQLPPRPPGQIWIFWSMECPNYIRADAFNDPLWHHQFNWTMNYRLDADIWYPYYFFIKREHTYNINLTAVLSRKRKMAAWVVSNCNAPSQRDQYVQELQKYLPVDVYGKCNKMRIGKNSTRVLTADYKFYLALENSLCKDYVTEKALKNMNMAEVVVVVRGGADYSKFLPKGSYVNTADFKSPKELAAFLRYLDTHPKEYLQYFKWKRSLRTTSHPPACRLCLRLLYADHYRKTYDDVWRWYSQGQCEDHRNDF